MSGSWKDDGLEPERYIISKANGEPTDPNAKYFVLRYDKDPHARRALREYAKSVEGENPQLAADIYDELGATQETFNEAQAKRDKN